MWPALGRRRTACTERYCTFKAPAGPGGPVARAGPGGPVDPTAPVSTERVRVRPTLIAPPTSPTAWMVFAKEELYLTSLLPLMDL